MSQKEDLLQPGLVWRCEPGFAMPRGAIYPEFALFFSDDRSIVAQNLDVLFFPPQAGERALSCTRLTNEQDALPVDCDAAAVSYHTGSLCQVNDHEKFKGRTGEKIHPPPWRTRKKKIGLIKAF